ncbi:hypothetical protein PRK78_002888 [Emydomyces testavorans]|uniref:HORMA domain-containing protein n=1 Tax=Emydomyces testavorans TaxID=2070801 RepID=A0AAF0DF45_9EURO|nr:hypothetical protein PRK78_002888 [Emydomyces testavorans]
MAQQTPVAADTTPAADADGLATTAAHEVTTAPVTPIIAPPTNPTTTAGRVPETYAQLASSFCAFLAVSLHQVLYLRSVYPPTTFLSVRQYNHAVKQSRHPRVCSWINDACSSVEVELLKCTLTAVSFVIVSARTNRPLERYTFDMSQIPRVSPADIHTPFASAVVANDSNKDIPQQAAAYSNSTTASPLSSADMEAQFRAVLARLASACARLTPLPQHEEYQPSLFITVRADADAPAGVTREEQVWIPAEPDELPSVHLKDVNSDFPRRDSFANVSARGQSNDHESLTTGPSTTGVDASNSPRTTASRSRAQTVPVRRVDAGEMKLEVWVEEALEKFEILDRLRSECPP